MLTVQTASVVQSRSAQVVATSPNADFKAANQVLRSLSARLAVSLGVVQVLLSYSLRRSSRSGLWHG